MEVVSITLWALVGLAVLLLGARGFPARLGPVLAPWIEREALARQPDAIHLHPLVDEAWRDAESADAARRLLVARGFTPAGDYAIEEMPGVHVRLLAHEAEDWYAALCEHPLAGSWLDLVRRTPSGASVTWTTAPPTGLDDRPGHPTHRVPGAHPGELFGRARREALPGDAIPARREWAGRDFEQAYAESIGWRKRLVVRRQLWGSLRNPPSR